MPDSSMNMTPDPLPLHLLPLEIISLILEHLLRENYPVDISSFVGPDDDVDDNYTVNRLYMRGTDFPVLFERDDYLRRTAAQAWLKANTFIIKSEQGVDHLECMMSQIPSGYNYLRRLIYRGEPVADPEEDDGYLVPNLILQQCPNTKYLEVLVPEFRLAFCGFDRDQHCEVSMSYASSVLEGSLENLEIMDVAASFFWPDWKAVLEHRGIEKIRLSVAEDAAKDILSHNNHRDRSLLIISGAIVRYLRQEFARRGREVRVQYIHDRSKHFKWWAFVESTED